MSGYAIKIFLEKNVELFANSGDPDQTLVCTVCQLPFCGFPDYNGLKLSFSDVFFDVIFWAALCEYVSSGICGQKMPRSACASAYSGQGLPCPQTESLNTVECFNGEQMPG